MHVITCTTARLRAEHLFPPWRRRQERRARISCHLDWGWTPFTSWLIRCDFRSEHAWPIQWNDLKTWWQHWTMQDERTSKEEKRTVRLNELPIDLLIPTYQTNESTHIQSLHITRHQTGLYRQTHANTWAKIKQQNGCHDKPTCWNHWRQVSSCVFATVSCLKRGAAMGRQTMRSCFKTISIKQVERSKKPTDSL